MMTPFGRPVVPEVYMSIAMDSLRNDAAAS